VGIDSATPEASQAEVSGDAAFEIFARIAKKYELFNTVSSLGQHKRWLRRMIELCPIDEGTDLLDIAAGTGDVSFAAARMKRPAHIQITDLVPEMLEIARRHGEEGATCGVAVDFDIVDAQEIPYPDNSYDVVSTAYGIRNMPDRMRALSEAFRVLKPGGSFVCLEFSTPTGPVLKALYRFYLKYMIPFWGGLITGDRKAFIYLRESILAFPDQESFAQMLVSAGFEQVKWANCSGGITAIHCGVKP